MRRIMSEASRNLIEVIIAIVGVLMLIAFLYGLYPKVVDVSRYIIVIENRDYYCDDYMINGDTVTISNCFRSKDRTFLVGAKTVVISER